MFNTSRARRAGVAFLAATGLVLVPSITAYAHVTVSSPDASPGGFGKLVFRVPSESDSANTTSVTVQLPTDTPFAFVSIGVVPGWTAVATTTELAEPIEVEGFTITEAVSSVTWTADGDGMTPHQFTEFALSAGPFPSGVEQLVFPATQTYSDGEVVEWVEPTVEGGDEPERPAPVLVLTASDEGGEHSHDSNDNVARGFGIAGIAIGVLGIVTGRRRSQPSS